jgi:hypothetical protein
LRRSCESSKSLELNIKLLSRNTESLAKRTEVELDAVMGWNNKVFSEEIGEQYEQISYFLFVSDEVRSEGFR